MNEHDLVRLIVRVFEKLSIPYFVTGGMAAIAYGEPRYTSDVDVVADIPPEMTARFAAEFPFPEFYLEEHSVRNAIAHRHQFNILHPSSSLKVDVMIPKRDEYDRLRMSRAAPLELEPGLLGQFASPEDVILKKLVYFREGQIEKHLRDIASMLLIRGERIDRNYITDWSQKLGVDEEWKLVCCRVDTADETGDYV